MFFLFLVASIIAPMVGAVGSLISWGLGLIWIGCLGFMDGQPFTNEYGPDPKGRNDSDSRAQASQQQPPVTVQVTNQFSSAAKIGDQLRELKRLQNEGLITQEEFDAQKAKVLAGEAFISTESGVDGGEQEGKSVKESALPVGFVISSMVDIPGRGFSMCKYEVTQTLWVTVMGNNPSHFKGADNPVETVSWDDCQQFVARLNALPEVQSSGRVFRLPTEEEWEYACRAGTTGKYSKLADGAEITEDTLNQVAWFKDNSNCATHRVGQKEPNAFGLYDMHGNVWEWTQTAVGGDRVCHGGSWRSSARDCEFSSRNGNSSSDRRYNLGFRLCASGRAD